MFSMCSREFLKTENIPRISKKIVTLYLHILKNRLTPCIVKNYTEKKLVAVNKVIDTIKLFATKQ